MSRLMLSESVGLCTDFGEKLTSDNLSAPKKFLHRENLIPIDRVKPFDPTKFKGGIANGGLGKGWSIWRGSNNSNGMKGKESQDARSIALTELDLSKVLFKTMLNRGEDCIKGEERLARLKNAGHISLDAKVFQTFWENKHLIPESWKERTNGDTIYVLFDGTILRNPHGYRCVLCLYFDHGMHSRWEWYPYWLGSDFGVRSPSAVIVSPMRNFISNGASRNQALVS